MREVAITGVGMHRWGKFPDKSFVDLGAQATINALKDANLEWTDVQEVVAAIWVWGSLGGLNPGPSLTAQMGETGIPVTNLYTQCASATDCVKSAYYTVASGARDIVLAVGLDKSPEGFFSVPANRAVTDPFDTDTIRWKMVGLTNPAYWAMECRKRMEKYGTTERDLARAKVVCSKHGALNPDALYRKVYTEEEVLASPLVVDPLRLLEICAVRDGAAAAVVCSLEKARQISAKPIVIAGVGHGSPLYGDPTMVLGYVSAPTPGSAPITSESYTSCQMAFHTAGIGPEDIDILELPDNSSWHYLHYPEMMGFFKPGEMDSMLAAGETTIDGKLPINTSGGFASFGEAVAASGLAQVCEVVNQLRGQCGARQVKGATVGMAQTYGMMGNSASIILKR